VVLGEPQLNRVCLRSVHYSPTWDLPLDACINHKSAAAIAFIPPTNPRTRPCPLVRNYYFRLMQIANSRRGVRCINSSAAGPARSGRRALMTTFDFSNNAEAAANAVCHAWRSSSTYVQRAIRAIILINRRHPFLPRMCYLDDIIKSSDATAFLNPRPDSLAGSHSSEQKPPFWLAPNTEKHKYLAKIKEEKFSGAFTIVF
jgi:hypothetical protein